MMSRQGNLVEKMEAEGGHIVMPERGASDLNMFGLGFDENVELSRKMLFDDPLLGMDSKRWELVKLEELLDLDVVESSGIQTDQVMTDEEGMFASPDLFGHLENIEEEADFFTSIQVDYSNPDKEADDVLNEGNEDGTICKAVVTREVVSILEDVLTTACSKPYEQLVRLWPTDTISPSYYAPTPSQCGDAHNPCSPPPIPSHHSPPPIPIHKSPPRIPTRHSPPPIPTHHSPPPISIPVSYTHLTLPTILLV